MYPRKDPLSKLNCKAKTVQEVESSQTRRVVTVEVAQNPEADDDPPVDDESDFSSDELDPATRRQIRDLAFQIRAMHPEDDEVAEGTDKQAPTYIDADDEKLLRSCYLFNECVIIYKRIA